MTISAVPFDDKENGPESLRQYPDRTEGVRYYRVNTRKAAKALTLADGLPDIGDPWDEDNPGLKVIERGTLPWGGQDGTGGENGWTKVEVRYSTRAIEILPYQSGDPYTVLGGGDESITAYFDRRAGDPGIPPGSTIRKKIGHGDGASKIVGVIIAEVFTYRDPDMPYDWGRLIELKRLRAVNEDALGLPVIRGTPFGLTLGPGEVRYAGFNHEIRGGWLEIVHQVELAPDFYTRWHAEEADGSASIGEPIASELYVPRPFTGIF